jgi:PhnB protein
MRLSTYLYFDGECEAAFKLYEAVLDGRILMMLRYADAPSDGPADMEASSRIMHARLEVAGQLLMGSDTPPGSAPHRQGFSASITVASIAEAERIYRSLSEGGTVSMPIGETFFAHRFAMVSDRFGTPWLISCEKSGEPAQIG